MPSQKMGNNLTFHASALFGNGAICSPFDFEEDRSVAAFLVISEAELKAVLFAIDRGVIKLQIVRIEIEAVDGVREVREGGAIFVDVQVTANKLANGESDIFWDEVLQLETLKLHVVWHGLPDLLPAQQNWRFKYRENHCFKT